MEGRANSPAE
jgi:hypothetical protein